VTLLLPKGMTLVFKGRHVGERLEEYGQLLHGCCKRDANQLQVTQDVFLKVERLQSGRNGGNPAPASTREFVGHAGTRPFPIE
jgi:hypothetical protein